MKEVFNSDELNLLLEILIVSGNPDKYNIDADDELGVILAIKNNRENKKNSKINLVSFQGMLDHYFKTWVTSILPKGF